jgi:hypothetical protein
MKRDFQLFIGISRGNLKVRRALGKFREQVGSGGRSAGLDRGVSKAEIVRKNA